MTPLSDTEDVASCVFFYEQSPRVEDAQIWCCWSSAVRGPLEAGTCSWIQVLLGIGKNGGEGIGSEGHASAL